MNPGDLRPLLLEYAAAIRYGENPVPIQFGEDREQLWLLLGEAETLRQAAHALENDVKAALAETIQTNETVRFGDTVYRVSPQRNVKITDPEALKAWLADDWDHVIPVTPSTQLRAGGITAVCQKRGVDRDTFEATFLDITYTEPKLRPVPVSKAPKYAAALEHGQSTFDAKHVPPDRIVEDQEAGA